MRRFNAAWLFGVAVYGALSMGCEDGPTQTYKPSPAGAGDNWNDGRTGGSSDPSRQGFTGDIGGGNKQEICPGPLKKMKWAAAFAQPIEPPRKGAGIDMAGSDTWEGLTVEQAEAINCQSTNGGDYFGDGNQVNYWGDNGEVIFEYLVSTRRIVYMGFNAGYTGKISFHSRDNKHQYVLAINQPIKKDGQAYPISWDSNPQTGLDVWPNEIADAIFATFSGLPTEANCRVTGHCIIGNFGDQGYMFLPAVGFAFRVPSINASQPTPSTPYYFDQYLEKVMPFSQADPIIKLDQEGPLAKISPLGPQNKTCAMKMGMTYGDLLSDCVQVTGDNKIDTAEKNKLLGGLTHGNERFHFDLSGVDVNFSDKGLKPDDVVHDKDVPTNDDVATQFRVDQGTLGKFANDYVGNDGSKARDLHATGLVYAEFIRLVQERINTYLPAQKRHALGDAACLTGDLSKTPPADGCTGFEGFVVPFDPSKISDAGLKKLAVMPDDPAAAPLKRGLKPGHQAIVLCDGPGQTACKTTGDTFPTAFARLLSVFGKGKLSSLPPEMQDARFFFRAWATAFVKYLLTEDGTGTATPQLVQAAALDPFDLFFDSEGSGQFEIAEYIDRRYASAQQDLTDVSILVDVRNGIMNDYTFSRDLFRGEEAIYTTIREDRNNWPGKERSALLTNVFGSPALMAGWKDHTNATRYECATYTGNGNVSNCEGEGPPLDANKNPMLDEHGAPLLAAYKGAMSPTGTIFRLGDFTPITVKQTYPNILQAMVTFPQHVDPYDTGSAAPNSGPNADFLIPWVTKQPGIGFSIPLNGQQNKFISTYQLDFSGTTITANVDYDFVNPKKPSDGIKFLAVETNDFLGEVFLCIDPDTKDLLHARMYAPVAELLDWINNHPKATQACGLIVRYSPYGNYPDFITSLNNGVKLGITQGGGFGRVVDVVLFVPGQ